MKNPFGMSPEELRQWMASLGEPRYRADQVAGFIYRKFADSFAAMTTLPAALRERLQKEFPFPLEITRSVVSGDGAEKLLLTLADGESIEMVLIPASDGRMTFCLSTQVGCPVRCVFCASGADGLVRNLTCAEIIGQFIAGARRIGRVPDNVVFMGIGEGLLNFDALAGAIAVLTDPYGFGLGARRITVSTSGYVPGMRKLAALGREINLAVSLHAPDDALRARLIPDFVRYPVAEILAAADEYLEKCGRMVTLEYVLLAGVNDSPLQAQALARLAKKHHAKVNLIAFNPAGDSGFRRPARAVVDEFAAVLEKAGSHVTLRVSKGSDSAAACGQLRRGGAAAAR